MPVIHELTQALGLVRVPVYIEMDWGFSIIISHSRRTPRICVDQI
jgi:hypothetical protein